MLVDEIDELVGLSDDELDAYIRDLELRRRADTARISAAIAAAEARQLNAVDGHRTMKGYLRATCNWSNAEVGMMRCLARTIDRCPEVGDALLAGRIGVRQATELAKLHGNPRVKDRFDEFVPLLVRSAEELSFEDFRVAVQRFVLLADPDGTHRDIDASIEQRDAYMVEVGGSIELRMTGGDPLVTAELLAIFNHFLNTEFEADLATRRAEHGDDADARDLARTGRQRRHDAMVAILRTAYGATERGTPTEPLVNIIIDADTFARVMIEGGLIEPDAGLFDDLVTGAETDLASMRCETTTGVALHPHHVLRAALTGHVRRVVVDADSVVIDQGRKQRMFVGSGRRAAMLLVRHCEHPGCDLPTEWCQVDHADEWTDGGVTDQVNARVRCGGHNREKHRKKLTSKRATNGQTYTIRSDGSVMLPVGARPPVFPDEDLEDDPVDDPATTIRHVNAARQRLAALPPSTR